MKNSLLLTALIIPIFFLGCSSKKIYEPKQTQSKVSTTTCATIIDTTSVGATLSNGTFISKNAKGDIPKGFKFVNDTQKPLFVNIKGNLIVQSKEINLNERVITASLFEQKVAFITQSNRIGIYNLETDAIEFQHIDSRIVTLNSKTVPPLQIDDIIIFPTLNGKLLVVSNNQIVREIVITPRAEFNNPIFLGVLSNTLIAATLTDIIALGGNMMERMQSNVADMVIAHDYIYLFTKDGKVQKLDERLQLISQESFQFANFIWASSVEDKIYAIEKAGYALEFDADLNYKVYELRDAIEGLSFLKGDSLYYGGKCYNL